MQTHRRWQRKKDARPGDILSAAFMLFADKGFHAVKVEDIARCAGVSIGTPYLYFKNKQKIFEASIHAQMAARFGGLAEYPDPGSGSATERLYHLVEYCCIELGRAESAGLLKLLIAEAGNFPELATPIYEIFVKQIHARVASILQTGIDNGEFRPVDVPVATDVLIGTILMPMLWHPSLPCLFGMQIRVHDPQHLMHQNLDIMISGLSMESMGKHT